MLYCCLIAPVAFMCRAESCYSNSGLENVIDPEDAIGPIEPLLIKALANTPYTLLKKEQLKHPLPAGIEPTEYCPCADPCDKVFHMLLQMTD